MNKVYLSIDPGDNTGYAWFNEEGIPVEVNEIRGHDKFMDWLEKEPLPKFVIIETYRNRPWSNANRWSDNKTSQLIGAIKRHFSKNKIELKESEPANLYIGLKFLGMAGKYPRGGPHVPDALSATAHGAFVLQRLKIRKPVIK